MQHLPMIPQRSMRPWPAGSRWRRRSSCSPVPQQIYEYVEAAGGALAGVHAALEADPSLLKLLESPLVLSIVALTYHDRPAHALRVAGTPDRRLELLFAAYTERMLEHRAGRFTPAENNPLAGLASAVDA
jgi:hypothetical protein